MKSIIKSIGCVSMVLICACFTVRSNQNKDRQSDSTILVKKDSVFTIDLTAAVSQGFSWQLRDSVFGEKLRYMKQTFTNQNNSKAGSDGLQHFSFKATRKGKTVIRFIYVQPFIKPYPKDAKTKQYSIIIH